MAKRTLTPKQQMQRRRDYLSLRAFREAPDAKYSSFWNQAIDYERRWREAILRIVEIKPDHKINEMDLGDVLRHLGIKNYRPVFWNSDDAEGYAEKIKFGRGSLGGSTTICTDDRGRAKALVLMRRSAIDGASAEYCRAVDIALLYHEIGHVDDFEKGLNVVIGTKPSVEAGEYYAHEFACKQLRHFNLKVPLGFYIGWVLEDLSRCGVAAYASSASKVS